jgi:hypothetical protein
VTINRENIRDGTKVKQTSWANWYGTLIFIFSAAMVVATAPIWVSGIFLMWFFADDVTEVLDWISGNKEKQE